MFLLHKLADCDALNPQWWVSCTPVLLGSCCPSWQPSWAGSLFRLPGQLPTMYHSAQPLDEGLLAPSASLYTLLSHRDISCHRIPPLNFSWGDSGCNTYESQTAIDTCHVSQVVSVLAVHLQWGRSTPLHSRRARGRGCHSTSPTLQSISFTSGLRWCDFSLGPGGRAVDIFCIVLCLCGLIQNLRRKSSILGFYFSSCYCHRHPESCRKRSTCLLFTSFSECLDLLLPPKQDTCLL